MEFAGIDPAGEELGDRLGRGAGRRHYLVPAFSSRSYGSPLGSTLFDPAGLASHVEPKLQPPFDVEVDQSGIGLLASTAPLGQGLEPPVVERRFRGLHVRHGAILPDRGRMPNG